MPAEDDGSRGDPLLSDRSWAVSSYRPDVAALAAAPTRVVIAVGEESLDTFTGRTAVATAELLGQQATVFPSHHGGFLGGELGYSGQSEAFAKQTARGARAGRLAARARGVHEDRVGDGLPVGSLDSVSGSLEREQPCTGNFPGERLSVLEREHRVIRAVNQQRGDGDRGQRLTRLALRSQAVFQAAMSCARSTSLRTSSRVAASSNWRAPPATMRA